MRTKVQPKKKTAKKTTPKRRTTRSKQTAAPKKAASTAKKEKAAKKTSALDAAAKVLASSKTSMTTSEMIDAMAEKKLWSSPGGKTPDRTLYSAILREIATKGKDARFKKTERGKFALAGK
ncbi:MAG: HTH domain-containing protein [Pirellulaceae bacterium]